MIKSMPLFVRVVLGLLLFAAPVQAASITLLWDPSPDATVTGYSILYGTQPGVHGTRVDIGNTTTYTLGLTPQTITTYYFVVTARSAGGDSDPTPGASLIISPVYPARGI